MKRRLGLATLALGTALAILTPATAMARDFHGDRHEAVRVDRGHWDRGRSPAIGFGFGIYSTPAPVIVNPPAAGYYDQYGVWHPYPPQVYYGPNGYVPRY